MAELQTARESEERFRAIVSQTTAGIAQTDLAGRFELVNDRYCEIVGHPREELLGRPLAGITHPEDRAEIVAMFERLVREGTPFVIEKRYRRSDGSEVWVQDTVSPIRDASGRTQHVLAVAFDITDRKQAVEALRASESRKTAILAAALDAIITMDHEGRTVDCNPAVEQIFGYSPDQLIGKPLADLLIPERLRRRHYEGLARYLATGEGPVLGKRIEMPALHARGGEIRVELSITRVAGAEPPLFTATLRDITERERTERALREREEILTAVFNQQFQFMAILSPEGILTEVNDLAVRATGLRREDVLGKLFWETGWWVGLPVMQRQWPERLAAAARADGPVLSTDAYLTADGSPRLADAALTAVKAPDGSVRFFIVQASDITERRKAEEDLRESEERFRTLADNIPQLAWMADGEGSIFWYNQRWFDYTGTTLEQMRGGGWKTVHHPSHVDRVIEKVARHFREGLPWEDIFPLRGKDGRYRWFLSRMTPIRDESGRVVRFFGTNTDVTEQRAAQEALREAHELLADRAKHLEALVQERTNKLEELVAELEAFSYSIAHDMRAPLRSIQGFGHFLMDEYSGAIDARGQDYLRRLTASAERMDRLIVDILNYSRMVRGDFPLTRIDTGRLLQDIIESYPAFQSDHNTISLEPPFPPVRANEAALTQCFSNLIANALKFVAPGVRPHVRVRSESRNGRVRIFVSDNGIGIPAEQHERIFAIFQRLNRTYEGTGIGLAIVKKAVGRMGGAVGLDSEPGKGSTFWIELPEA